MPIEQAPAPLAAIQTLNEILPQIARTPSLDVHLPVLAAGIKRALPSGETPGGIKPFLSAPVHVLGLKDLVNGLDLERSPPAIWTHILAVGVSTHAEASADESLVSADTDAVSSAFQSLNQGPNGRDFRRRFEELANAPDLSSGSYELAVLRVPALHIEAFWLKDKTGGNNLVVPFTEHNSLVEAGRRYTPEEFTKAIKPAAEDILQQDGDGKGG